MAKIFGRAKKKTAALSLPFETADRPLAAARAWLEKTEHREGCQCHRCHWAHGVIAGRITVTFEKYRGR